MYVYLFLAILGLLVFVHSLLILSLQKKVNEYSERLDHLHRKKVKQPLPNQMQVNKPVYPTEQRRQRT
ncbi:hypothetical protein [Candidatus Enterococcus ferrettii]|uniref:Uncharacterized protein n=1 Tax=Candidatus Enterococcus ferrettii TaxID=2815324 RepID=A0ABV0EYL2_9ENTE|nr:hypothetical protein [Enterococcus sp. 665A]MBO1342885.1 hypothetical protein [Enterococcus sp. 665A]